MKYKCVMLLLGFLWVGEGGNVRAQEIHRERKPLPSSERISEQTSIRAAIFRDVEAGLRNGDIEMFSKHLARQVYLSLRETESGYFSSNQAAFVIGKFFDLRRTVNFRFTTLNHEESMPYATGGGTFAARGKFETLQVYVAIARVDDRWVITQFNVY